MGIPTLHNDMILRIKIICAGNKIDVRDTDGDETTIDTDSDNVCVSFHAFIQCITSSKLMYSQVFI